MYNHLITSDCFDLDEYRAIQRAKEINIEFAPLYNKYFTKISNYIHTKIKDKQLSEDIASQVFMKALLNIKKYESKGYSFGAWLYKIAHNELVQELRNQQKMYEVDISTVQLSEDSIGDVYDEMHIIRLESALSNIKSKYLEIIRLRYYESYSFKEIGLLLGISENSAKVRCFRALEKLRNVFNVV